MLLGNAGGAGYRGPAVRLGRPRAAGHIELTTVDLDEIATALADKTGYEHR